MTTSTLRRRVHGLWFLVLLALVWSPVSLAFADLEVSATVQIHAKAEFEAPLTPYGTWVDVGSYGRCWHPVGVAVEWQPYCAGEWVWTDCGWYWESNEPWGWACYHYGYWVVDPAFGWVWVPGVEWAPAWVSWRIGGGYVGWAPLPPPGFFFATRPKPETFVFVNAGNFGDPVRPSLVIFRNNTVFSKTTEVGGVKRETRTGIGASSQRVMVNQGPKMEELQKATGKPFRAVPIQEAARRTVMTASYKHAPSAPVTKTLSQDKAPQPVANRSDHKDQGDSSLADHPVPGSPPQPGGPGGGHGHPGGASHGKGHD